MTISSVNSAKGHIKALDSLRGIAALAVFVAHFVQQYFLISELGWLGRVLELLGVWGVAIFFVLSGFLIHGGTLLEAKQNGTVDWKAYARRRFFRIVPAYFIALNVCAVVSQFGVSNMLIRTTLPDYLTHVFFISSFFPTYFESVNAIFWTVVVEFHFYLIYPLLFSLISRTPALRFFLATFIFGLAFFVISSALVPAGRARIMLQHTAPSLFWQWCLGVLLAEMAAHTALPSLIAKLRHRWIALFSLVGAFAGTALPGSALQLNYKRFVLPFFCFLLVGNFVFSGWRQLRWDLGERCGDISYSIYLWHPLALFFILKYGISSVWMAFLGSIALLFLMAIVSYRTIELPFQRIGRNRLKTVDMASALK